MEKKEPTEILSLRIPRSVLGKIIALASEDHRSTGDYVRLVLRSVAEEHEFKVKA